MKKVIHKLIVTGALLALFTGCSNSDFAGDAGGADKANGNKKKGSTAANDPSMNTSMNPSNGGSLTVPPGSDPKQPLAADDGGNVALSDVYTGAVEYQGNQCPGGGACGDENKQFAIDGLDLRNISATGSLSPASAAPIIQQYVGKTVLTGIGSGAAWGSRKITFRASNVPIYFSNDVINANPCSSDRVPVGKPKVARTSQMDLFICAKLDSRIRLGPTQNFPAPSPWNYGAYAECPTGHIVMGGIYPGTVGQPWQLQCAPLTITQ